MSTRSTITLALPFPRDAGDDDPRARRRFAAIVRSLVAFASVRPRATAGAELAAAESSELPTRRLNRLRRMFGRLGRRPMQSGKSRRHTR